MDAAERLHGLAWRLLAPTDLAAMAALHRASLGSAGPDVVKPESPEFLASLLAGRGRVVAAWDADVLVAYGVLQHGLLPEDDPRPHLRARAGTTLAKLAGAAVAPGWRGLGLQRALVARRIALAQEIDWLFATVAPANPASWRNLLAAGFAVRTIEWRYGGHARYLLLRERGAVTSAAAAGEDVPAGDLARQQALLAAGWRGVAAQPGTAIRYVPPEAQP